MLNIMLLGDASTFCSEAAEILKLVGWVLTIFKIAIPLIIIALGLLDLGKAAISSKPEEIKKTATGLIWRLVGGVAIFFIPTIVMLVLGFVGDFNTITKETMKDQWPICRSCIETPWSETCKN